MTIVYLTKYRDLLIGSPTKLFVYLAKYGDWTTGLEIKLYVYLAKYRGQHIGLIIPIHETKKKIIILGSQLKHQLMEKK